MVLKRGFYKEIYKYSVWLLCFCFVCHTHYKVQDFTDNFKISLYATNCNLRELAANLTLVCSVNPTFITQREGQNFAHQTIAAMGCWTLLEWRYFTAVSGWGTETKDAALKSCVIPRKPYLWVKPVAASCRWMTNGPSTEVPAGRAAGQKCDEAPSRMH